MQITLDILNNLKTNSLLSKWEADFIESVAGQFASRGKLSPNQLNIVNRCLEKTSEQKVSEHNQWLASYDDNKREILRVCAEYYKHEGYFASLTQKVLEDPNFIPSELEYNKMCENKYAKKVLESYKTPFLFDLGELAQVRATASWRSVRPQAGNVPQNSVKNEVVIVVKHDRARPRQHKFVCCSLVRDATVLFWIEERHLKNYKGAK
mgnify:FL=1